MSTIVWHRDSRWLAAAVLAALAACGGDNGGTEPEDPVATSLELVSGDNQRRSPGETLLDPLVVLVKDQFGNGMAGVTVTFGVTSGGGSVSPVSTTTGSSGEAQTTWTLGATEGEQTVEAGSVGLTGSPVTFRATASDLIVESVSPDTLRETQSATITGRGFDPVPSNNTVWIGSSRLTATAAAADGTTLEVTLPDLVCEPLGDIPVSVVVAGQPSNSVNHPFEPSSTTSLAVGEELIVRDPTQFCLRLAASATGAAYVIGVGSTANLPAQTLSFLVATRAGSGVLTAPEMSVSLAPSAVEPLRGADAGGLDDERWQERLRHQRAELALREKERALVQRLGPSAFAVSGSGPALAVAAVPNPGDPITIRVPDIDASSACTIKKTINATVRVVGSSGIFVTDNDNPTTDALTLAEIEAQSDTFDVFSYATDTLYFGAPSDIDDNGKRVIIVLTVEVNKMASGNVAGFVFSGDLFSRTQCASSDEGEIFYGQVPDPDNAAGTRAKSKDNVLGQFPSLVAHEFAHNIQQSRRLIVLGGDLMSTWEMEGQATLAEEVVGHKILGNEPGQNYGRDKVFNQPDARWYNPNFAQLALYYGWNGNEPKNANAPDLCPLFATSSLNNDPDGAGITCEPFWFYGASWAFQRYVSDRFGPGWGPNDEASLHRDWIDKSPTLAGVANVEALLSLEFDTLYAKWSAMQWTDDRVGAVDASLTMTSWNLFDIFSAANEKSRLRPDTMDFVTASRSRGIKGSATAYTILTSALAHPALALRVRDPQDLILGTSFQPQMWVVRTQ